MTRITRMTIEPHHPDRLLDLLGYAADRRLSDAEAAELRDLLAHGPDARETYAAYMLLHNHLLWERGQREAIAPEPPAAATPKPAPSTAKLRLPRPVLALAAALLLAACAFAIVTLALNNRQSPIANPQSPPPPLASVTDVLGGTLLIDDQLATAGNDYPGRTISLDAGEAEFMLPNRVTVKLRGSTSLTIRDAMGVSMASGSADFDCPPGAVGFFVDLPCGMRVVDLGTRFEIDLDATIVRVTEGEVRAVWTARGLDAPLTTGAELAFGADELLVAIPVPLPDGGFEIGDQPASIEAGLSAPPDRGWKAADPHTPLSIRRAAQELRPRSGGGMLGLYGLATPHAQPGSVRGGARCTFATEPGRAYELRFHLARQTGHGVPIVRADVFDDSGDLAHRIVPIDQPPARWSDPYILRFVARSEATTLRLAEAADSPSDRVDAFIDDVSLFIVSEPDLAPSPQGILEQESAVHQEQ